MVGGAAMHVQMMQAVGLRQARGSPAVLLRRARRGRREHGALLRQASPHRRCARRLVFAALGAAISGLTLQVACALLGWWGYLTVGRAGMPVAAAGRPCGGHVPADEVEDMRQWLLRYATLDSLLPLCLALVDPLDPAQPLMCAVVQAGASLLRLRDYSLDWRSLDPEASNCAAVALSFGFCSSMCLVVAAVFGCSLERQVRRAQDARGGGQTKPHLASVHADAPCEGMQCAICLDFCEDKSEQRQSWCELPCGHCYHRACVVAWLRRTPCCPLCRRNSYTTDAQPTSSLSWDPLEMAEPWDPLELAEFEEEGV